MATIGNPRETRTKNARKIIGADEYRSQFYIDEANLDRKTYEYRWVETHCMNAETQSLNNAILDGWVPVPLSEMRDFAETAELLTKIRGRGTQDEFVRRGDQILMRMPLELYNQYRKAERKLSKEQMHRVDWAEQSASIRAPTFVSANEYSRTQELSKAAAKAFADED